MTAISTEQFQTLVEHLEDLLPGGNPANGCDNTLKLTMTWLYENHPSLVTDTLLRLKRRGGQCDCEVLFNVVDRYDQIWPPFPPSIYDGETDDRDTIIRRAAFPTPTEMPWYWAEWHDEDAL